MLKEQADTNILKQIAGVQLVLY